MTVRLDLEFPCMFSVLLKHTRNFVLDLCTAGQEYDIGGTGAGNTVMLFALHILLVDSNKLNPQTMSYLRRGL